MGWLIYERSVSGKVKYIIGPFTMMRLLRK